jgi:preprotein translocase subunit SecD
MRRSVAALIGASMLAGGPAHAGGCEAVRLTVEPPDRANAVAQVLRHRLETAGSPSSVEADGAGLRVLGPAVADSLLTRPARVEFRIVAAADAPGSLTLARTQGGHVSVEPEIILDESHLRSFRVREDGEHGLLAFRFDPHAMKNLMSATVEAVGRKLALIVDDVVVAEPEIRAPVASTGGEIDAGVSVASARELAALLPDGRLSARVSVAGREPAACKTN